MAAAGRGDANPDRDADPAQHALITATCMRLQAEMLEWSSGRGREMNRFDGMIRGLSRRYQVDEASPFRRLKHTTREKDVPWGTR